MPWTNHRLKSIHLEATILQDQSRDNVVRSHEIKAYMLLGSLPDLTSISGALEGFREEYLEVGKNARHRGYMTARAMLSDSYWAMLGFSGRFALPPKVRHFANWLLVLEHLKQSYYLWGKKYPNSKFPADIILGLFYTGADVRALSFNTSWDVSGSAPNQYKDSKDVIALSIPRAKEYEDIHMCFFPAQLWFLLL